jgi:hypothetical protein
MCVACNLIDWGKVTNAYKILIGKSEGKIPVTRHMSMGEKSSIVS